MSSDRNGVGPHGSSASTQRLVVLGYITAAAIVWLLLLTSGVLNPNSNESTF